LLIDCPILSARGPYDEIIIDCGGGGYDGGGGGGGVGREADPETAP
jgi:hypothetical protein